MPNGWHSITQDWKATIKGAVRVLKDPFHFSIPVEVAKAHNVWKHAPCLILCKYPHTNFQPLCLAALYRTCTLEPTLVFLAKMLETNSQTSYHPVFFPWFCLGNLFPQRPSTTCMWKPMKAYQPSLRGWHKHQATQRTWCRIGARNPLGPEGRTRTARCPLKGGIWSYSCFGSKDKFAEKLDILLVIETYICIYAYLHVCLHQSIHVLSCFHICIHSCI